jgi:Protein of unknown function (DUF2891)
MRATVILVVVLGAGCESSERGGATPSTPAAAPSFDLAAASRFASLALSCVTQEYPNKIAHTLESDADAKPPRELTPAFYGCFDWHSAVHGHWLLVRLLRLFPGAPFEAEARAALAHNLSTERIEGEVEYLLAKGRVGFERPYGLAWLLQLCVELDEWDDPLARELAPRLDPLESAAVKRLADWLPKLSHPIRTGEHFQTAFSMGLLVDYARDVKNAEFLALLVDRARAFHLRDVGCPLSYEPSGQDFLSPCIAEADLMRRVLTGEEFATWLRAFLPAIPTDGNADWLPVSVVTDKSDGKLAHLDGLNLSRAWMLDGIASVLPADDPRRASLLAASRAQGDAGIAATTGAHYAGGHWLGTFAVYYASRRGVR